MKDVGSLSSSLTRLATWLLLAGTAAAQSLVITNGVHTYPALADTTVIMTGQSELRLADSGAPLSNCLVHLNSQDAWVLLPGIKASAAVSYLGQMRVNGAAAVVDSNVRVVQHGMGAVVIPHPSTLQPLQVFTGPHFTGASTLLSQYAAYNGSGLGVMNQAISSFKLKRGYMATLAQNENGTGASRCYVAQDGDLEVSLLPATLDDKVRFVRIFPWRWGSKKGVAGNIWQNLNLSWYYNWNLDQNSTRDVEYVAIRQTQWWPGLNQNWQVRGINHLLGFNEPDHPEQANMTVAQAIAEWPTLLATGLRVGAPAITDGGSSWLYSFIDQANAAGLRVDFVPVHYYRCYDPANATGAANQFYNYLKGIYDRVKRPLWVTEWNNGANWTSCADPTFAQQQAAVAKMIEMLDNTPFVERYAIFNWVEDVRRVQWDDGSLTSAGVTYRDKASPLSYTQDLPDAETRSVAQYAFEGDLLDGSGFGNNAFPVGLPGFVSGHSGQGIKLDGTNSYLQLPPNIANSAAFSFAAWVYWEGGGNWQRLFDFGNDTTHYLCLTPRSGSSTLRFVIRNGGAEQIMDTTPLPIGQWRHVAVTLSGNTGRLYLDGVQVASSTSFSIVPSSFNPRKNFLGESQFVADPLFNGRLDDVLIADYALTATQIAGLVTDQPPAFASKILTRPAAVPETPYLGSTLAGTATDLDANEVLTYSKATGPDWLTVAPTGILSGTPGSTDSGTNTFTVRVTDRAGSSAFAVLLIDIPITLRSGTWLADSSGLWGASNLWSGGFIANGAGFTADFSTINITVNRVVALDASRSIGALKFGDTAGSQWWTVSSSGGSILTLDTRSSTQPLITVTNTATLSGSVAGTNGLVKNGPGILVLAASNSLSGLLNIDSAITAGVEGAVRIAHPSAVANVSAIQIRNNNNGSSTLQLQGSVGALNIPARLAVSGRNVSTPTIQNLSGTNTLAGFAGLESGGTLCNIQSDVGLLVLSGLQQYVGSLVGSRSYAFTGAGDHLVSGRILNSTNGSTISLTKSGAGTLTLAGANTYTGSTVANAGTLLVNGSLAGPATVNSPATLGGSGTLGGAVVLNSGASLAPGLPLQPGSAEGASIGKLTANSDVTLQPGSITRMEISRAPLTNDVLSVGGTLAYGGTLQITNVSGSLAAGDAFRLFQAGSFAGSFDAYALPLLGAGLAWNTAGLTNGTLSVIASVATYPTNLDSIITGDSILLSWPASHLGWRLQVQTNALGSDWITVPGSEAVDEWRFEFDPAVRSLFFRLTYP